MNLFMFILISVSITILLSKGDIFEPIKYTILKIIPRCIEESVLMFMYCSMCIGFWVGILVYSISPLVISVSIPYIDYVFAGSISSLFSIGIDRIIFSKNIKEDDNV
jgi:hypothetical protein